MTSFDGLGLRNRRAIPLGAVPVESVTRFRDTVLQATRDGWRLVALFGMPDAAGRTMIVAVLGHDDRGQLGAIAAPVEAGYPALTPECPEAHLFEREIA